MSFSSRAAAPSPLAGRSALSFAGTTGSAFFSSTRGLIHSGPSAAFRFVFAQASRLVAVFDMLSLTLLFVRVTGFIPLWHKFLSGVRLLRFFTLLKVPTIPQKPKACQRDEQPLRTPGSISGLESLRAVCNSRPRFIASCKYTNTSSARPINLRRQFLGLQLSERTESMAFPSVILYLIISAE